MLVRLAKVREAQGDLTEALKCYEAALASFEQFGDRFNGANVLASIGDLLKKSGDTEKSRAAYSKAAEIFGHLGMTERHSELVSAADGKS